MRFKNYIGEDITFPHSLTLNPPLAQKKSVKELEKMGFKIVMWDADFVGMMDKRKTPVEVYPDGTIKYIKLKKY
jgi:hypothetical protein